MDEAPIPAGDGLASLSASAQTIEQDRPAFDRALLAEHLNTALNRAGYTQLATGGKPTVLSDVLGGTFLPVLFWGLGSSLGSLLGTGLWLKFGFTAGAAAILLGLAAIYTARAGMLASLASLTWLATAIVSAFVDGDHAITGFAIPLGIGLCAALVLKNLALREARDVALALAGVARAAPFAIPIVVIAILLPALTADVWRLSVAANPTDIVGAGALSVGFLTFLVDRRMRRDLAPVLAARCRALGGDPQTPNRSRSRLVELLDGPDARIADELPFDTYREGWPEECDEYAPFLATVERKNLRRPLPWRLCLTVLVIGCLLVIYLYCLLAVLVPIRIAEDWGTDSVPSLRLALAGTNLVLPGGAYISMAVLLGVLATAVFLAFVLTEDRISSVLTEALIRDPIDRYLLLAVPYTDLLNRTLGQPGVSDFASNDPVEEAHPGGE